MGQKLDSGFFENSIYIYIYIYMYIYIYIYCFFFVLGDPGG